MNFKSFVQMTLVYIVALAIRYIYFPIMRCYWKFFDDDSDSGYGPFVECFSEYTSDDFIGTPKTITNNTSNKASEDNAGDTPCNHSDDELWIIEKEDSFECLKRASKDGSPASSED